jgi:peptidoglycan lytic transglycosylase
MRFDQPAPCTARLAAALGLAIVLCGCASGPPRSGAGAPEARVAPRERDGPGANAPADLASIVDAEPRIEPVKSGGANKPYQALGREYVPATRDLPFSERGLASWYGGKFHGRKTASGEVYDMYAMTAAHPTLPIPSYARIRNPANGREVLVRVNDRGPFVAGRIVDLSYAAALKLDLLRSVAPVELERITFDEIRTGAWRRGADPVAVGAKGGATPTDTSRAIAPPPPPPAFAGATVDVPAQSIALASVESVAAPPAPSSTVAVIDIRPRPGRAPNGAARGFWVQLGAFRERDGAETFRRRVAADSDSSWLEPLLAIFGDAPLYRVQAGPYPSRDDAEGAALRARSALGVVPIVVERR